MSLLIFGYRLEIPILHLPFQARYKELYTIKFYILENKMSRETHVQLSNM